MFDAVDVDAWLESTQGPEEYTPDQKREIYERALEDGHFCVTAYLRGDHPGKSWVAWCANCHVSNMGTSVELLASVERISTFGVSDLAHPAPHLLTWSEARQWMRGHRSEHGLDRQGLVPCFNLTEEPLPFDRGTATAT